MSNLREQQQAFLRHIFQATEQGQPPPQQACIAASERMSAAEHFEIYRNGVIGSLTQALADTFPVCCRLVGEKFFDGLAYHYVCREKSGTPDLSDFGESLPPFIQQFEPAASLPYLPDVAHLEWCWHRAFHAEDDGAFDFKAFSLLSDEQQSSVIFCLPHSAHLLSSAYPIDRIWEVNQPEYTDSLEVDLDEGAVRLFVWRQGFVQRIERVSEDESLLLEKLQQRKPFSQACGELLAIYPELDIASLIPQLIQKNWIMNYALTNSGETLCRT